MTGFLDKFKEEEGGEMVQERPQEYEESTPKKLQNLCLTHLKKQVKLALTLAFHL